MNKMVWFTLLGVALAIAALVIIGLYQSQHPEDGEVFSILSTVEHGMAGATVLAVHDGDTITVKWGSDQEVIKIRLAGIDAPELSQPYGDVAHFVLEEWLKGKMVNVWWKEKDRYGRVVGIVYPPGVEGNYVPASVNGYMIGSGMAWHYSSYDHHPWLSAREREARQAKIGLWADKEDPEPPWEYRKRKRNE